MVMRVNAAAVVAATLAAILAVVGHAKYPAQVVVALAAGGAFLAAQSKGRHATPSDWLTVRLLLAGNLIVFATGNANSLGSLLAATIILAGVLLAAAATHAYLRAGRGRDRSR
jgi:hypothetical protein